MNTTAVAILGDIHANLPALEAVWADMEARGVERRFCLGDLVGYGVQPNEVIAFMRRHAVPTLMGNYDEGVGHNSHDCGCAYTTPAARALGERSIAWTNAAVSDDHKRYLRNLPFSLTLQLGRARVVLVHGSPRRVNEYLFADRPADTLERLFDLAAAQVMVCGHTHLPYDRTLASGRRLINAGSVGKPKDGDPRAGYIILTPTDVGIGVEFVRVAYAVEQAAQAIEATTMPHEFAAMLRTGGAWQAP